MLPSLWQSLSIRAAILVDTVGPFCAFVARALPGAEPSR